MSKVKKTLIIHIQTFYVLLVNVNVLYLTSNDSYLTCDDELLLLIKPVIRIFLNMN